MSSKRGFQEGGPPDYMGPGNIVVLRLFDEDCFPRIRYGVVMTPVFKPNKLNNLINPKLYAPFRHLVQAFRPLANIQPQSF